MKIKNDVHCDVEECVFRQGRKCIRDVVVISECGECLTFVFKDEEEEEETQ